MPTHITESDVRHVARLSRLKLTDEQVTVYTRQLERVLEAVEKLGELEVSGVEPMAHPLDLHSVTRADEPGEALSTEAALANAPASDPPYFQVPKVLGDGSGA